MKTWAIVLLLVLSPALYAQQSVPEIPFDSQPNFLKLPADLHMGEASGVAVNSKGHICITPGPTQYLYSSDAFPGRVYKLSLDGKVLGILGVTRV